MDKKRLERMAGSAAVRPDRQHLAEDGDQKRAALAGPTGIGARRAVAVDERRANRLAGSITTAGKGTIGRN
jgi:hypothetical protein